MLKRFYERVVGVFSFSGAVAYGLLGYAIGVAAGLAATWVAQEVAGDLPPFFTAAVAAAGAAGWYAFLRRKAASPIPYIAIPAAMFAAGLGNRHLRVDILPGPPIYTDALVGAILGGVCSMVLILLFRVELPEEEPAPQKRPQH